MNTQRYENPTALSYWFPKLERAGLPVPQTIMLDMPPEAQECVWSSFDGREAGDIEPFLKDLKEASMKVGYPCFLRTDHTSAKHEWNRTCFVTAIPDLRQAVFNIAYFSDSNSMAGELSWEKWAVREFLPTIALGWCPQYGGMPVCREFRFFVNNDEVECFHPYWPIKALQRGGIGPRGLKHLNKALYKLNEVDKTKLIKLASAAGKAVGGRWSVDILDTERGWYITDMAEADKSFHWEGCSRR